MSADQPDVEADARGLVDRLTEWQRAVGDPADADVRGTGEAAGAVEELKRRLDALGARYHWQPDTGAYVLDGVDVPPGGEAAPA